LFYQEDEQTVNSKATNGARFTSLSRNLQTGGEEDNIFVRKC